MKCVICKGGKFRKLMAFEEASRYDNKKYPLFKCASCGMIRPYPLPYTEETKHKIYATKDKIDFESREYDDYFRNFRQYKNAIKRYNIKGRSLDIGCGHGHLMFVSKKLGIKPEGVELDRNLADILKKKGFLVHNVEIKDLKTRKYDLITLNHVLEHIDNLQGFVQDAYKLLNKRGYLMVSVPYIYGLIPRILRTRWYGQGYGQHLNFFSIRSIKKLLENNGFKIVDVKLLSMDYAPFRLPAIIRKLINFICALIVFLRLGDNLFVIAKKE